MGALLGDRAEVAGQEEQEEEQEKEQEELQEEEQEELPDLLAEREPLLQPFLEAAKPDNEVVFSLSRAGDDIVIDMVEKEAKEGGHASEMEDTVQRVSPTS